MSTQTRHGPITRRVIEALRRQMRMKVVDLAAFRAGQEYARDAAEVCHAQRAACQIGPRARCLRIRQNQMSIMAEQLLQLPETKSFVKQIDPARMSTRHPGRR